MFRWTSASNGRFFYTGENPSVSFHCNPYLATVQFRSTSLGQARQSLAVKRDRGNLACLRSFAFDLAEYRSTDASPASIVRPLAKSSDNCGR